MNRVTLEDALLTGRGVERPFHCHEHDNTRSPTASVNVAIGVWVCYSCGAAGKVNGVTVKPAQFTQLVKAMTDGPTDIHHMHEAWLDVFDAYGPSPYWTERVGAATAELFRCGTHPFTGLPTYPIRNRVGQPLGVVQRTGSEERKYVYPPGVAVSRQLFGYEHAHRGRPVVLVEGAGDVMAIYSAYDNTPPFTPLGVYGAGLHKPQTELVTALAPRRVVCAFDRDPAGQQAGHRSVDILTNASIPATTHTWTAEVKDFGDATPQQVRKELDHVH